MNEKDIIIRWISNLVIYEKDYETLNLLLENTNNEFFIRIMSELAHGNILIEDLEPILGGEAYDKYISDELLNVQDIEEQLMLILNANDVLSPHELSDKYRKEIYENFIILNEDNEDIIEEVSSEEIYSFFNNVPESSYLHRINKEKIRKLYEDGIINKNFLNIYLSVPIVPINYQNVILNNEEIKYAHSKDISINEMKKIKSLSLYYRSRGE